MPKIQGIKIDDPIRRIVGITARDRMRKRIIEGRVNHPKGKSKKSGKHLLKSRKLLSGFNYKISGNKVLLGVKGPAKTYARILHDGGTIYPKNAKFLAIPLTPAARVKKPRDFENTFVAKGVIFRKKDNGKPEALYALKKSVEIPAFDYFKIDQTDMGIIVSRVKDYLVKKYG